LQEGWILIGLRIDGIQTGVSCRSECVLERIVLKKLKIIVDKTIGS